MTDEAKKCLAWIQDEYNINFGLVEVNGKSIVDLVLEWHNKVLEEKQKAKKTQDEQPTTQVDFEKITDENGRTWYNRTHITRQREESRLLHPGDIVKYTTTNGYGIMMISSFDYESDFVARSYVEISTFKNSGHTYFATKSCPGFDSFSFATDEEIKQFFKDILDNNVKDFYYYFNLDSKSTPDYIKERYTHYIKELIG